MLYAGLIYFLSSRPWNDLPVELFYGADKVIHYFMYFGLGFMLIWAFRATRLKYNTHLLFIAAIITVLYGISDELHQIFVPGRTASIADIVADTLGGLTGAYIAIVVARYYRHEHIPLKTLEDNRI